MAQEYEVMVQPNQELLALFDLTVDEACRCIARTRMSIRRGFSETDDGRQKQAPNPADIIRLRIMHHFLGRECDDDAVVEHVRVRYKESSARFVARAFADMAAPVKLDSYSELCMLLADAKGGIEDNRLGFIPELLALPGRLIFYTSNCIQEEALQAFIGPDAIAAKGESLTFKNASPVGCWETLLIAEPRGEDKMFYYGKKGFFGSPYIGGRRLLEYLEELEKMDPLQRLLME